MRFGPVVLGFFLFGLLACQQKDNVDQEEFMRLQQKVYKLEDDLGTLQAARDETHMPIQPAKVATPLEPVGDLL